MVKNKLYYLCVVALLTFSVSVHAVTKAQLDYLVSKIQSDDETKSSQAAIQLAKYGPEAIVVLPDLLEILREPGMHLYTGGIIRYIVAEEPTEKILELINDDNSRIQSLGVELLKERKLETNQALAVYTDLLDHDNSFVRLQAIDALCEMDAEELCLGVVVELAGHETSHIRAMAVTEIGEIGVANDQIKSILLGAINEPDRREGVKAALIYQQLYPEEKKGIEQLRVFMKDEDRNVRGRAAQALGDLKDVDTETMDMAIALMDDNDSWVVARACYAMIRHDIQASRSRELLLHSLESEEFMEVAVGLLVLQELGPDAKDYEDRLMELATAEDEFIQVVTIITLGKVNPSKERVLPILNKTLKTTDNFLVWNVTNKTIDKLTKDNR